MTSLLAKEVTTACCGGALSRTVCERLPMSNITLTASDLSALIAAEVAKAVAARPAYTPSDYKIVYTDGIPSASGKKWASIEITHGDTVTKLFVDRVHEAGQRSDGADQTIIYASFPKERVAKPAAKPAAAKKPAKAAAKPAVKAEVVDDISW